MLNTPQVETYVEVSVIYNDALNVIKRTNIDEGSTPKWNEVLEFELNSDHEKFTKEELMTSDTQIIISLFDKRKEWTKENDKKITQEENRFLGSVKVPLLTVLCNPEKLDTNFRLERPLALSAYRVLHDEIYFIEQDKLDDEKLRENE